MKNELEICGKYNKALVFTNDVDDNTINQIKTLCDQEFTKNSKIRIMPDVHLGIGCTIGTTMTLEDKVVPNLVGVDIGCGVEVVKLKDREIDFEKLDKVIYNKIPSGFKIRKKEHEYNSRINLNKLKCYDKVNIQRAKLSIGSLGSGNHFIEVNQDKSGNLYLVIHSGSRHLGNEIARLYQQIAIKKSNKNIPRDLAYLEGLEFDSYIHDMKIAQEYASINRQAIADVIVSSMKLTVEDRFTTIHNYIDTENMILRKGAVSANKDEVFLIPINMKDGSLLCKGLGNGNWNYSAPHGAGRILSRNQAKSQLNIKEYKDIMKDVYTTSVNKSTLDECPLAYKSIDEIINSTKDTLKVLDIIKPLYNFKAGN